MLLSLVYNFTAKLCFVQNRVEMERVRREFLCNSSQALKMESTFDATNERECSVCFFDLHLSAAGCHNCSPDKYACLNHAKQLCTCSWGAKFFLFRYDINELNVLVDALEGKLSAIYRWARQDLGLALSSYVNKERQVAGIAGKLSLKPEESVLKEASAGPSIASVKKEKDDGTSALLMKASSSAFSPHKDKLSREPLASESIKASSMPDNASHGIEGAQNGFQGRSESLKVGPVYRTPVTQLSVEGGLCHKKLSTDKREVKGTSSLNDVVILLSDDEGDEMDNSIPSKDTAGKQTVNMGNNDKPVPTTSIDSARVTKDGINCSPSSESMKVEDNSKDEIHRGPNQDTHSFIGGSSVNMDIDRHAQAPQVADTCPQSRQPFDCKPNKEGSQNKTMECAQPLSGDSPVSQNNLDRGFRQKGPRIAKVVRRLACNVEPLDYGVIQPGKLWCDNRVIYPKGIIHVK